MPDEEGGEEMDYEKEIQQLRERVYYAERTLEVQNWTILLIGVTLLIRALGPLLTGLL